MANLTESLLRNKFIGQTSKNVLERLKQHNHSCNKWTKANKPFIIVYTEKHSTKKEAIQREHFLKSGQGRKWLDENIPL